MHGNNPTRDAIQAAFTEAAKLGLIRSWSRLRLTYGGAPKWQLILNDTVHTADLTSAIGTVEIRTYQEGKLVAAALMSARARPQSLVIAEQIEKSMGGFTDEQLKDALDIVACRTDWKDPISCELPSDLHERDRRMIDIAITHFTGSLAEWTRDGDGGNWHVRAAGYYASIGC